MTTPDLDQVLAHEDAFFAAAVKSIVRGESETLQGLLDEMPELICMRSAADHRSTLLHYVASNGIEDELQLTPESSYHQIVASDEGERAALVARAVDVARQLVAAGADVDATCETYGGGAAQTTLNLLVSSGHPQNAGVQGDIVHVLCAAGAAADGVDPTAPPLATAIAFSCIEAAEALAECGARIDNIVYAAALDRLDVVESFFEGGALRADAGALDLGWLAIGPDAETAAEQAMVFAALCGAERAMVYLLDHGVALDAYPPGSHWTATALHAAAATGRVDIAAILVERGADQTIRDRLYGGTALDWAESCGHPDVAALLR